MSTKILSADVFSALWKTPPYTPVNLVSNTSMKGLSLRCEYFHIIFLKSSAVPYILSFKKSDHSYEWSLIYYTCEPEIACKVASSFVEQYTKCPGVTSRIAISSPS